jgi:uroporphyrinogen decarboxylase
MKGRTMVSPHWMREHLFGRIKRVADAIHDGGKYFSFHSCGNVNAVVPDLIEAGIDALNPIEVTSGMDLAEVKRLYGDRLVIMGNANANIVQMGTPDEVRAEVRRCLDDAAAGGGYLLCGGRTPATPTENMVAYFDEAKTYQGWRKAL